jgi:hypothetical protein
MAQAMLMSALEKAKMNSADLIVLLLKTAGSNPAFDAKEYAKAIADAAENEMARMLADAVAVDFEWAEDRVKAEFAVVIANVVGTTIRYHRDSVAKGVRT